MVHKEEFYCPRCNKTHNLTFEYWRPDNRDQFKQEVTCACNTKFLCVIEAEVSIEFIGYHPEIIE